MKIKSGSYSDIGNYREVNQDYCDNAKNIDGDSLFIVCDGMGGHDFGEVASKFVVENFIKKFVITSFANLSDEKISQWLVSTVETVKEEMKNFSYEKDNKYDDMGTTLSAIIFANNKGYIVNVGDSRIYKANPNKGLELLTLDQNLWNSTQNYEQYLDEYQRNFGDKMNEATYWKILTSALGPKKNMRVDTYVVEDTQGFYALTTDGVHDYIDDETFYELLTSDHNLKKKSKEIVNFSLNNFSTDNLTILTIELVGD